jgi:hypothetical protein
MHLKFIVLGSATECLLQAMAQWPLLFAMACYGKILNLLIPTYYVDQVQLLTCSKRIL